MRIDTALPTDLTSLLLKYSQSLQRLLKRFQHLLRAGPTVACRFDRFRQQRVKIRQVCSLATRTSYLGMWQSTWVWSQLLDLLEAEEELFKFGKWLWCAASKLSSNR